LLDNVLFYVLNNMKRSTSRFKICVGSSLTSGHCDCFFDSHKTMVQMVKNSLKEIRESLLMSKSELAREANVSPITITRIEEGKPCRLETKRKILLALGYGLSDSKKIFGE
jgi:DNA-binding XRE family transcriptional regulator